MTNAEAIEYIKKTCYGEWCEDDWREAMDTAIKALEAQKWIPCSERLPDNRRTLMNDDTIFRQAAIDALGEEPPVWYDGEDEIAERNQWRRDVTAIKELPSAQQEYMKEEDA